MKYLLLTIAITIGLASCNKSEGTGGAATISGKVEIKNYSNAGNFIAQFPAQDVKVFIVYGDGANVVGDFARTSYDGSYEFKYLRKGSYKVFAYSDCVLCDNGLDSAVTVQIQIDGKKDEKDAKTIVLRR